MTDNLRDSRTDNQGHARDQTKRNRTTDSDVLANDPNRKQSFASQGGMKGGDFAQTGEPNTGFKGNANPEFTGKGPTGRQGGSKEKPGHRDLTSETRTPSHENYATSNTGARKGAGKGQDPSSRENYISGNLSADADKPGGGSNLGKGEYGNTGTGQGRGMTGHGDVYTGKDGSQGYGRGGQGSQQGNFGMRDNPGSEYGGTGPSKGNAGNTGNVGGANKDHGTSRSGTATQQLEAPDDEGESRYGSAGYKVTGTKGPKSDKGFTGKQ